MGIPTRRRFITGSAVTVLLNRVGVANARRSEPPDPPEKPLTGIDRLGAMMMAGDLILADAKEGSDDLVLYEFLASPLMLAKMRDANVGAVNLELQTTQQNDVDRIAAATSNQVAIRRQQLIDDINTYTPTLTNRQQMDIIVNSISDVIREGATPPAGKSGFRVNFVDTYGEPDSPDTIAYMRTLGYHGTLAIPRQEFDKIQDRLVQDYPERLDAAIDAMLRVRGSLAFNSAIAKRIEEQSPPDRCKIVVYGFAHAVPLQQAMEAYGKRPVGIVVIHASQAAYERNVIYGATESFQKFDYKKFDNYLIKEGRFTDDPLPASAPKPGTAKPAKPHS
jgi:hypothetical protein